LPISIDQRRASTADGYGWQFVFLFDGIRRKIESGIAPPQLLGWCCDRLEENIGAE